MFIKQMTSIIYYKSMIRRKIYEKRLLIEEKGKSFQINIIQYY